MASNVPKKPTYSAERSGSLVNFFKTLYKAHNETTVMSKRYKTNSTEFKVIARPSTPVKPHKKTAVCIRSKAFFIESKKQTFCCGCVFLPLYLLPRLFMEPVIRIQHLFKNYGTKPVLKDINLEAQAGEVIGYIGPNGAGKSTTVKIICGLLTDYEGSVQVKGLEVKDHTIDVKRSIGYIPELAELYDVLTPMEFLSFMGALYGLDE